MLQQNIPHLNLLTRICQVANFRLVCVQVPLPITPDFVGIDCRLVRRPLLATMWCEAPMFTMIFGWVGSCIDNIRFCIECTAVGRVRVIVTIAYRTTTAKPRFRQLSPRQKRQRARSFGLIAFRTPRLPRFTFCATAEIVSGCYADQ